MSTTPAPISGAADPEHVRLTALAIVRGTPADQARAMSTDALRDLHAQAQATAAEHPSWLPRPRSTYADLDGPHAVETVASWIVSVAESLDDTNPLTEALYDVLVNAAGHTPEFSERSEANGGGFAPEPWGCSACGCADGTGACDTWASGVALAVAVEHGPTPASPTPPRAEAPS